jgi:hypothetical protein
MLWRLTFPTIIQTMRDTGASGMAIERVMEQLNSLLGEASVLADDLVSILC